MQGQRRQPRSATEAKAPRRELDVNKERLIFCLTSLIGHKVTAQLRGNIVYEGVFHGCALEGDYSITLKYARSLPVENSKSGRVIETLVIPGKDFLQVDALDVDSHVATEDGNGVVEGGAFATDSEITAKGAGRDQERELVPWSGGPGGGESLGRQGKWTAEDMFKANEEKYGISTSFNEDHYTTKLDPSRIPQEKRDEAERIAKDIESSNQNGDAEARCDDSDDEEAKFSSVARGGSKDTLSLTGSGGAAASKAKGAALELPVPKAGQAPAGDALAAADYRSKRGMITQHSPMSMISEMKRINALNLEPAVPKIDDKTGNDWINFKVSQSRNKTNPSQGDGLKMEFEQSLADINKRANQKQQSQRQQDPESGDAESSRSIAKAKAFSFNPNAKDFTFNPTAVSFTPGGVAPAAPSAPNAAEPSAVKTRGPDFNAPVTHPDLLKQSLESILDSFAKRVFPSTNTSSHVEDTSWTEATGPSFKDVLGPPNPMMPMGQLGPGGGQPWQQPGMGQMGAPGGHAGQPAQQMMVQQGQMVTPEGQVAGQPGGPPMMGQQGFMMAQASGGQPQQMFQPMYPAPAGAAPMRPPGGGQMPVQGQQQMVFNQQGQPMAMPGGQQMMPGNMVQGQNMPKFGMPGNMVMMVPAGQGMQQGMMVPQGMSQGQPGQQGPGAQQMPVAPQMMQQRPT